MMEEQLYKKESRFHQKDKNKLKTDLMIKKRKLLIFQINNKHKLNNLKIKHKKLINKSKCRKKNNNNQLLS